MTVVIASAKFTSGAWIVLVVIPLLVINFLWISRQYQSVADRLRLPREAILKLNWQSAKRLHNHVVVLVGSFLTFSSISDLEKENGRLKKAVAELTLDKQILKEALEGNF